MGDEAEPFADALGRLHQERSADLVTSLSRRFTKVASTAVEDAVQDAFAEAADPDRGGWFRDGYTAGGDDELHRRLYTSAWRHARGGARRVGEKRTSHFESLEGFDPAGPSGDPEHHAEARELHSWLGRRLGEAADQFGGRRQGTMEAALQSMVRAGHKVAPLARKYGLPRTYLAEASSWLKRRVRNRARGEDDSR